MVSQQWKHFYYSSVGKASLFSYFLWKMTHGSAGEEGYVNIGCGPNYVKGMINVDGNLFCKKDLWLDVTLGLPFQDRSLRGVYASHVVEHFEMKQISKVFREFYRVLKPGGAVRLVVPSLEYAIQAYLNGHCEELPDWPDRYSSPGGRFNNFMLCQNQHKVLFDMGFLEELLQGCGFSRVYREQPNRSDYFLREHLQFETGPSGRYSSLIVESVR